MILLRWDDLQTYVKYLEQQLGTFMKTIIMAIESFSVKCDFNFIAF